jgi:hypothetical protein
LKLKDNQCRFGTNRGVEPMTVGGDIDSSLPGFQQDFAYPDRGAGFSQRPCFERQMNGNLIRVAMRGAALALRANRTDS